MRAFFTIVAVSAAFVGCDSKQVWPPSAQAVKEIQSNYDAALADATNSIPYAADFARLYPGAWGSFSYFIAELALQLSTWKSSYSTDMN